MITLRFWNGQWHIITLLDGAVMCRLNEEDWDDNSMITEYKNVPGFIDGMCVDCVTKALEANQLRNK